LEPVQIILMDVTIHRPAQIHGSILDHAVVVQLLLEVGEENAPWEVKEDNSVILVHQLEEKVEELTQTTEADSQEELKTILKENQRNRGK